MIGQKRDGNIHIHVPNSIFLAPTVERKIEDSRVNFIVPRRFGHKVLHAHLGGFHDVGCIAEEIFSGSVVIGSRSAIGEVGLLDVVRDEQIVFFRKTLGSDVGFK